jgi:PAS domain S-box-containing protein
MDIPALTSVRPALVPMVVNAALSFIAIGTGLLLLPAGAESGRLTWCKSVAAIFDALALMISILTLAEYATGIPFGIDELFFADPTASDHPGRPALATAVSVFCAGVALLLLARAATRPDGSSGRSVLAAHVLALMSASVSYVTLAGYLFDVKGLYSFGPFNTVSIYTGIASGLAALAILHTASEAGWRRFFAEAPATARAFERRLIFVLASPLLIGGITVWGARVGAYDPVFASALFAFATAAGSSALTWRLTASKTKIAEEALRQSEARYRGIFEHAGTGIAIADLEGRIRTCNPAYAAMLGYSGQELQGLGFLSLLHPGDREANLAENRRLQAQEIPSFEIVNRYIGKGGELIWVHKHVSLLCDAEGRPTATCALATDITERKRQDDHVRFLMREVNHRSKNMLSVVQVIARQTAGTSPIDFAARFERRLHALAASQDVLVKSEWQGANLEVLVRSQLAHFEGLIGTRIKLQGPPLFVTASAAQALGMALHELATNAGKYGVLANSEGQVVIEWSLKEENAGARTFAISWREQGGCPVVPPSKRGFGSTVICDMAELSLGAKVELDYPVTGLCWRLRCPVREVVGNSNNAAIEAEKPAAASTRAHIRPRILVVEDEPLVAFEIARSLGEAGFEIVGPARTANQALQLVKETGCDAAVLDINLGSETSEPIALGLTGRGTPFISVSGYSREQQPVVFSNAPALTKPVCTEMLAARIERLIRMHRVMARLGVEPAAVLRARDGLSYRQACSMCFSCGANEECLRWLDEKPDQDADFCPIAQFFKSCAF